MKEKDKKDFEEKVDIAFWKVAGNIGFIFVVSLICFVVGMVAISVMNTPINADTTAPMEEITRVKEVDLVYLCNSSAETCLLEEYPEFLDSLEAHERCRIYHSAHKEFEYCLWKDNQINNRGD